MRNKFGVLSAIAMLLCFTVQAHAAAAGFVDKKVEGFTISLPADWEVLTKQQMDQLDGKPAGAKMVLAATAKAPYPKITGFDQGSGNLTQAEFEALTNSEVERMCGEFLANLKTRVPTATNVTCTRQKVAKGSALVVNMDLPEAQMRNSTWSFYRGPKRITVVSSLCAAGDSTQLQQTERALKSIKLSDK